QVITSRQTLRHSLLLVLLLVIASVGMRAVLAQVARTGNRPPVANAGSDQTITTSSTVMLNGGRSTDADGDPLTYSWRLMTRPLGSQAALDNPSDVTPSFKVDIPGNYVVRLVVNDGFVDSAAETVTISRTNSRPVAEAGRDQTIVAGATVRLDRSGS